MLETSDEHRDRCGTAYAGFMSILEERGPEYAVGVSAVTVLAMFTQIVASDREAADTLLTAMRAVLDAGNPPTSSFSEFN